MNISLQNVDKVSALLTVQIEKADYQEKVEKSLKTIRQRVNMPGFRKEDIHVDLKGDTLTIRAERHSDYEKDDKKKSYLHVERSYGSYERSFDVSGIKLDAISVKYNDGVLAITLPKEEVKQPEVRSIDVM